MRAFLDANVMIPARWRDILLTLAEADLYTPLWSSLCLEEIDRHLPGSMTVSDRQFLLKMMNEAFPGALVEWPEIVDVSVHLQINEKDRRIVGAALWGHADVLPTNDRDLRDELFASQLIDAQSMPEFIAYAISTNPSVARRALIAMVRRRWGVPSTSTESAIVARLQAYFQRQGWSPSGL